jgi:hypothetical protein
VLSNVIEMAEVAAESERRAQTLASMSITEISSSPGVYLMRGSSG